MAIAQVHHKTKAPKFLTFQLGSESYGMEILKVREIVGVIAITPVPRTPDYVLGVVNLRGKVIPVVNIRSKFGMEDVEYTEETCIIIVALEEIEMGIVVDNVSEVLSISDEQMEEAPTFGTEVETEFILGMGKLKDKVILVLDIGKVLTESDSSILLQMSGNNEGEGNV